MRISPNPDKLRGIQILPGKPEPKKRKLKTGSLREIFSFCDLNFHFFAKKLVLDCFYRVLVLDCFPDRNIRGQILSSLAENYLSVSKVVTTNSVNFRAFGAFWWKYFF